jgi:hypothetical protein
MKEAETLPGHLKKRRHTLINAFKNTIKHEAKF